MTPRIEECVSNREHISWYTVIVAVSMALTIAAFTLFQHSMFPHKDAAHESQITLVYSRLSELRVDMKLLTTETSKLREEIAKLNAANSLDRNH